MGVVVVDSTVVVNNAVVVNTSFVVSVLVVSEPVAAVAGNVVVIGKVVAWGTAVPSAASVWGVSAFWAVAAVVRDVTETAVVAVDVDAKVDSPVSEVWKIVPERPVVAAGAVWDSVADTVVVNTAEVPL